MEEKDIALLAMIVSVGAALVSMWQAVIARRALKLAIEQNDQLSPRIEVIIVNSFQTKSARLLHYVVDCLVLNKSRTEDSIVSASLIVQYKNDRSLVMNLKCESAESNSGSIGIDTVKLSTLPLHLAANDTFKGTFLFEISKEIFANCAIMDYHLETMTLTGIRNRRNIPIIPLLEK